MDEPLQIFNWSEGTVLCKVTLAGTVNTEKEPPEKLWRPWNKGEVCHIIMETSVQNLVFLQLCTNDELFPGPVQLTLPQALGCHSGR